MKYRNNQNPPQMFTWILKRLLVNEEINEKLGDFEEVYVEKCINSNRFYANIWYIMQILKASPEFFKNKTYWSTIMFNNYLKIAFRNLFKQKIHSFINIFGLAVGMACTIVTMLYVYTEWGFDSYHENKDDLYRLSIELYYPNGNPGFHFAVSSPLWGPTMKKDYPEVEDYVRLYGPRNGWIIKYDDKEISENNIYYADNNVFEHFSWELLVGDPQSSLIEKRSVILSESTAKKYFDNNDVIGKTLLIDQQSRDRSGNITSQSEPYTVKGIFKEVPEKSHVRPDIMVSYSTLSDSYGGDVITGSGMPNWFWRSRINFTFLRLSENYDANRLTAKFPGFLSKYPIDSETIPRGYGYNLQLQKLEDIHYSEKNYIQEAGPLSSKMNIYLFFIFSVFIVFIAGTNFTNLSTARSIFRTREVGMRKVLGARKSQIIKQFMGETIVLSFISMIIAIIMAKSIMPTFSFYLGKPLEFSLNEFLVFLPWLLLFALTVGIFSGIYPSLFISNFRPINILKSGTNHTVKRSFVRKSLVIVQFSISVFLIISTLIISGQINYMKSKNMGFNKDQTIIIPPSITIEASQKMDTIRDLLSQNPGIIDVTLSSALPGRTFRREVYGIDGNSSKPGVSMMEFWIDLNYLDFFDMELVAGRQFSKEFSIDHNVIDIFGGRGGTSLVINESAAKSFGWSTPEEAIGNILVRDPVDRDFTGMVIGVVKDFHTESLRNEISPLVFQVVNINRWMSIKLKSENLEKNLSGITGIFNKIVPDRDFSYSFLDEDFERIYSSEVKLAEIYNLVSILAIFIASLGLFGISMINLEARRKEVGIRKVHGAPISKIVGILTKEYFFLVASANIVTWPAVYYLMGKWLDNFAYKFSPGLEIYLFSGFIVLFIALSTITFQTIKTALANPINTLRYE